MTPTDMLQERAVSGPVGLPARAVIRLALVLTRLALAVNRLALAVTRIALAVTRLALALTVLVTGGSLLTAGAATAAARNVPTGLTQAEAEQLGTDAYEYGIPLMEFVRQQHQQTSVTVPNALSDAPLNQLGSARQLATAANQVIVQPNNDTLYTMGHVDLSTGPLVLHVPAVPGGRYYSFEFLDPYTNVFHYVGTRTTGNGAGSYLITGPSFKGRVPRGLHRIRSHYQHIWLVGRTLVYGPGDLPAVHRIQDGYRLIPLAGYEQRGLAWHPPRPRRIVRTHTAVSEPTGLKFFDQLGTALAENPPPRRDARVLRELRQVGIGPGLQPSREHLSVPVLDGLREAVAHGPATVFALRTTIATKSVIAHAGWFVPPFENGAFGTDYRYRAVVALYGIAANRPKEALYIIGVASGLQLLSGQNDYVLHFPAGQLPPARYFWSLTMYNQGFHLVANPINRYALASHTQGLERNPDGSLDIYLQQTAPPGHASNWLPAPAGRFEVTLRMYGPEASALQQRYVYPLIKQTS
jgi:hypothetical protein